MHPAGVGRRLRLCHGGRAGSLPPALRCERPVVCLDEASKQLVGETRTPLPAEPGRPERFDCEYVRNGTANLFMLSEPLLGWRTVFVTERRTAVDFAEVVTLAGRGAATPMPKRWCW